MASLTQNVFIVYPISGILVMLCFKTVFSSCHRVCNIHLQLIQVHFQRILYRHISFYCTSQILHFQKLKVCGNPASNKSVSAIYPTVFSHFVSLSHFGISHNISNFFIIIFVMVICDQRSLMLLLQKDYNSLKAQMMASIFQQ